MLPTDALRQRRPAVSSPHSPPFASLTMPPRGRAAAVSPSPRGRAGLSPSPAPAKAVAKVSKKGGFFSRHGNVWIYVPNLIGARCNHRRAGRQLRRIRHCECRRGARARRALAGRNNPNAR